MNAHTPSRRLLLGHLGALCGALAWPALATSTPKVDVWKDPHCGCCGDWIAHLQQHGFRVQSHDVGNTAMRQRLGLPMRYASCHTAVVDGYVIEGHVPAVDIQRLLRERPAALGLAVPGMPVGSPGMDGPAYGHRRDPYAVLLVQRDGSHRVWAQYHAAEGVRPVQARPGDLRPAEATSPWAEGEVRRLDPATGKITLRHGHIPDLDMPPMTMVFQVRERALLQGLQVGQRVRFRAEQAGGGYFVTEIKPAP